MSQKIMIVEDETIIANLLGTDLKKWGYDTYVVKDFKNILEDFMKEDPKLILLDINLPYFDGFYWCQKIREVSKVPIIFISSRNTNMDMVMAMNMGGDDFVTKPFSLEVLQVKIKALLRRSYDYQEENMSGLSYGEVTLDFATSSTLVKGQMVDLSKTEYKLLFLLMENHGKIMSREKLLRSLWEDERFVDDNTLTVNINRLRKKLEQAGVKDFIQTKVGQGYLIY